MKTQFIVEVEHSDDEDLRGMEQEIAAAVQGLFEGESTIGLVTTRIVG